MKQDYEGISRGVSMIEKLNGYIMLFLTIIIVVWVGYVVLKTQTDQLNEANERIMLVCNLTNKVINLSNIETQIIEDLKNITVARLTYLKCDDMLITRVIS